MGEVEITGRELLEELYLLRADFEQGGGDFAIFESLWLTSRNGVDPPTWATAEIAERWTGFRYGQTRSWEHVFNVRDTASRKLHNMIEIVQIDGVKLPRIGALVYLVSNSTEPISQVLFDEIGDKLGISGSTARDWWYQRKSLRDHLPDSEEKRTLEHLTDDQLIAYIYPSVDRDRFNWLL